jgi:hypothetical protein
MENLSDADRRMDPLAKRVARRYLVGEILAKDWLMAVRRGWLHVLNAMKVGSKERDNETFRQIRTFVQNLEEQLRFIYRPFRALLKMDPQGKKYQKAVENLRSVIDRVEDESYRKRQDLQWINEALTKREDEVRAKHGLPEYGSLLTPEESEHLISTTDWNAVLWKKYPELEEPGRRREYQSELFHSWVTKGFDEAKQKQLTPAFDKLLKILYDDAREIKQLTDSGQDMETEENFTEFDLSGVKVIIDDRTVPPIQVKQYIKYFDETHQLMRAKGFGEMWYGRIFVQCEECGGKNPHGEQFGVGGNYSIGKDDIRVFLRPSQYVVRLVAHEMAHRYWFKHMSGTQRARFVEWIESKEVPAVSEYGTKSPDEAFAEVVAYFVDGRDMSRDQLESMRAVLASDFLLIETALQEELCAYPYSRSL